MDAFSFFLIRRRSGNCSCRRKAWKRLPDGRMYLYGPFRPGKSHLPRERRSLSNSLSCVPYNNNYISLEKMKKNFSKYLDVISKTSTFAPAFERERH